MGTGLELEGTRKAKARNRKISPYYKQASYSVSGSSGLQLHGDAGD